jgi:hypothetical protein
LDRRGAKTGLRRKPSRDREGAVASVATTIFIVKKVSGILRFHE